VPSRPTAPADRKAPSIDRRLRSELTPVRWALLTSALVGTCLSITVIVQAFALARLLAWAAHPGGRPTPSSTIVVLAMALGARALLGLLGDGLAGQSATRVTAALRGQLLWALIAEGPTAVTGRRTGAIVLTATRGLRSLEAYISRYLPAAMTAAIAPVLAMAVLAATDWPSALVALGLVVLVPFVMIRLGRRASAASAREWSRLSSLSTRSLELLRGLPTLRALGRVDHGRTELRSASEAVADSIDATLRASLSSGAGLEFIAGVGVGLVAMLAGLRLLTGGISLTTAFAVILVTPEVFLPLRRAGAEFHASTEGRSAGASLYELLDSLGSPSGTAQGEEIPPAATPIEVLNLSCRYRGVSADALAGASLRVDAGDHLVVAGPSGSGKSTLLSALMGFVPPSQGRITIAGTSLDEIDPSWWHQQVALAPQRPHVFAASLRENLLLGGSATDRQITEVLGLVGLDSLIDDQLDSLDRILGEAGSTISAGERQRLGLARAMLLARPILLLDEATSHLDAETITVLRSNLGAWLGSRTVIEVGHRPGLARPDAEVLHLTAVHP